MLWADNRTRSTYSEPSDALGSRELEVLHEIASDEGPGSTETSLAVNGHSSRTILANLEKFFHNMITRCASIDEKQIDVLKASVDEAFGVVDFLVETNDASYIVFSEIAYVSFGRVQWVAVFDFALSVWSRERQKFLRKYPVQVTVFYFLKNKSRLEFKKIPINYPNCHLKYYYFYLLNLI